MRTCHPGGFKIISGFLIVYMLLILVVLCVFTDTIVCIILFIVSCLEAVTSGILNVTNKYK